MRRVNQLVRSSPFKTNQSDSKQLHIEIGKLLSKGAIEACQPSDGQFLSTYFLLQKANVTYRFILNLKKFNKFLHARHFKLEDIRMAINILHLGDYMCHIDLRDAYFLIPVHAADRKFLQLEHRGTLFQFTCSPFGLSTCPYAYTKIMRAVIKTIRDTEIRCTIYLDDILILGSTQRRCNSDTETVEDLLTSLGFLIDLEESSGHPERQSSGWGAACKGEEAHGFWSSTEQNMHINFLEILAAFLALKSSAANDSNYQILLRIDNTTAVAYLNKMGGVKYPNLNNITKSILVRFSPLLSDPKDPEKN